MKHLHIKCYIVRQSGLTCLVPERTSLKPWRSQSLCGSELTLLHPPDSSGVRSLTWPTAMSPAQSRGGWTGRWTTPSGRCSAQPGGRTGPAGVCGRCRCTGELWRRGAGEQTWHHPVGSLDSTTEVGRGNVFIHMKTFIHFRQRVRSGSCLYSRINLHELQPLDWLIRLCRSVGSDFIDWADLRSVSKQQRVPHFRCFCLQIINVTSGLQPAFCVSNLHSV